jgi:hypothetical protein
MLMGSEMECSDRIGLNFIRPDVNRPGNHDFVHSGDWLVSQYKELGVKWNRVAFSWVLIQPDKGGFDWSPYDRVVEACDRKGIQILATLGGHFDRPPVPAWAGESLKDVVTHHLKSLEGFVAAWVERYKDSITYWEILNEPRSFHQGLTVLDYVDKILKPSYRIIKSVSPQAKVLPCAYRHLPVVGNKEDFWDAARGHYDIHNLHIYQDWGMFRSRPVADQEVESAQAFRTLMVKHEESDKDFWVTETGWWGTCSLTGSMYDFYKKDPVSRTIGLQPSYTGRKYLDHPIVAREDVLRAEWMRDAFPRLLAVPGCAKVFLWVSLDEFEGGFVPDQVYGKSIEGRPAKQVDLWGIIAGDKTWRKSAYALQDILK